MTKTLVVIGPEGTEVTISKPPIGSVCVIVQAGATVRGTTYFQPALLNLSDTFAEYLAGEGAVKIATVVR